MLKPIFEGELNIFLKAPATGTFKAGTAVKLGANGEFAVAVAGDEVYGLLAQDVQARNIDNFKLDSVTHVAYNGEKAGVYFQGGLYHYDLHAVAVTEGDKLYVGANGVLTKTAPASGFTGHVAIAETSGAVGEKIRIRLV
jgi:sulfur transfer complex TusBCD TusB component (DsrH family)